MILYIGWTQLMLLNLHRIHTTIHKGEEAVLLILDNNAVSVDAVDYFKNANEFSKTFIVPNVSTMTKYTKRKEKLKHLPEILFYSKALIHFLESTFPKELSGYSFDEVYVPGFFNNVIFFLEIISRCNTIKNINYYDYGLGSYTWDASRFTKNIELISRLEYKIRRLNEMPYRLKFLKHLTNKMYVWEPNCLYPDNKLIGVKIPKFQLDEFNDIRFFSALEPQKDSADEIEQNRSNRFLYHMYNKIPAPSRIASRNHGIYFLTSYIPGIDEDQNLFLTLLQFGRAKDVILKPHVHSPAIAKKLSANFSNKCFVDSSIYLFEAMLCEGSFANKIIITRLSTVAFSPKFMFDQEPIVILTYKLFKLYKEEGNDILDQTINRLKNSYSDPSRIMVPTNMLEFKVMIIEAQRKIHNLIDFPYDSCNSDISLEINGSTHQFGDLLAENNIGNIESNTDAHLSHENNSENQEMNLASQNEDLNKSNNQSF